MNMEALQQNVTNLQNQIPDVPETHPNAALNIHMKNQYTVLSDMTAGTQKTEAGMQQLNATTITKTDLTAIITPIAEATTSNTTRITKLEEQTKDIETKQENYLAGISKEIDNRLRKQNNVAIFNFPESNKRNNQDKKKDDLKLLDELFTDINMGTTTENAVKTLFRIQKSKKNTTAGTEQSNSNQNGPKPLIVIFQTTTICPGIYILICKTDVCQATLSGWSSN